MDIVTFLALSGTLAWAVFIWRIVRGFRGVVRRVRWALFGPWKRGQGQGMHSLR